MTIRGGPATVNLPRNQPVVTGALTAAAAAFAPTDVAGMVAWYDFSVAASNLWTDTGRTAAVASDGDLIKGVTDKSGTGNHLSEETIPPTYKVNIKNSQSVARYAATKRLSSTFAATATQPVTVFMMVKPRTVDTAVVTLDDDSSAASGLYLLNQTTDTLMYAGASVAGSIAALNTFYLYALVYNGASSKMYRDGGAADGTGTVGAQNMTGITLGSNASGASGISGDFCECIVYDALVSNANIDAVAGYMATKWGTTWTAVV